LETLRILWFNWKDITHPDAGGAELFTHEIAKRLARMGHDVTLFVSSYKGARREEVMDGIKVVREGGRYTVYSKAKGFYKKNSRNYDLIIDEINTKPFMTPKFVNDRQKIVAVIHQLAREYWFYETPFPISVIGYYYLEKRWLSAYQDTCTVTVSSSTEKDLNELGFKDVHVITEGLSYEPLKEMPEKEREPTLIYLGRLKKAKRPDHALEAFRIVKKAIPNAKMWFVGDGPLRYRLERNAPEGVTFFGRQPSSKVRGLLSRAWLLVYPSVREGFGLSVIEANAHYAPAIAYDVPGLRDSIIHNETGLLVKENGSIVKLANAVIELLRDEEQRHRLSKNAAEWSKRFDWEKSFREFMKVFEREH